MADNKTEAQRSYNMSRIRGMNTTPEIAVRRAAYTRGLRYRMHNMLLPGRPDMVFAGIKVLVFIDGDFWHGWQFPRWRSRLSSFWQAKIERNRKRDLRNFAKLRRAGWVIVRIWEHEVSRNVEACVDRIAEVVARQRRLRNQREPYRSPSTSIRSRRAGRRGRVP